MKKRNLFVILALVTMLGLTACGGKEETEAVKESKTTTEVESEVVKETREELAEGQMYSYLTGEVVDEAVGAARPFAIMINNIDECLPQSGISQADILYECLVEADITRLMGVFQDIENLNKVGSIRSARHYYMDFAKDEEAIFTHYGQSIFAEERINAGYQTISGLSGYSEAVFYRSADRVAPHNVFSSKDGLLKGLEYTGLTRDYPEDYEGRLNFKTEEITLENGVDANKVTMPFYYANPWFEYNEEEGLYYRYQYNSAHVDEENGEQLKFKNLIVQYTTYDLISDEGHKDFALTGSGKGLLITNGKAENITWKRATENDRTMYYYEDGSPVYLNCGKSYISIVPSDTPVICE